MTTDVMILRDAVERIVNLMTRQGIKVTQRGSQAYVSYRKSDGAIDHMNIPYVPDDAPEDFVLAIHGFIDHECGHVLHSDTPVLIKAAKMRKTVASMHNVIEDVYIERKMTEFFAGSTANLQTMRRFWLDKMVMPTILESIKTGEKKAAVGNLIMIQSRAWGGQLIAKDLLADHPEFDELLKDFREAVGDDLSDQMGRVDSSSDALRLAERIVKRIDEWEKEKRRLKLKAKMKKEKKEKEAREAAAPPPPPADLSDLEDGDEVEVSMPEPGEPPPPEDPDTEVELEFDEPPPAASAPPEETEEKGTPAPAPGETEPEEAPGDESEDKEDKTKPGAPAEPKVESDEEDTEEEDDETSSPGGTEPDEEPEDETSSGGSDEAEDEDDTVSGAEEERPLPETDPDDEGLDSVDLDAPDPEVLDAIDVEGLDFDSGMAKALSREAGKIMGKSEYLVFSTEWDVIEPAPLTSNPALIATLEEATRPMIGVMAKQLERALAAESRVGFNPGMRTGRINTPALFKVATGDDRVFRRRYETHSKRTAVSLLIDCSGSMGGRIRMAGMAAYGVSQTLDRLRIRHEVLGFTTKHHHPEMMKAMSRERDRTAAEKMPYLGYGRDEPLYMPIFKAFDEKLDVNVKSRMANLIDRPNFLNQNPDGECLQIAGHRLMQQRTNIDRRILIVLSDGEPAAPPGHGLDEHLHKVVRDLSQKMEVVGIGIQTRAVEEFYPRHVVLNDLAELPTVVMRQLTALLLAP